MRLLAYTIGGQKIGVDILSWNTNTLSGNTAFQAFADTGALPTNYTNISSFDNWANLGGGTSLSPDQIKAEMIKLIPNIPTTAQYLTLESFSSYGLNTMSKVGNNLVFGAIISGSTVLTGVTSNAVTGATNLGSGNAIYTTLNNCKIQLKSISGGTGISITNTGTQINVCGCVFNWAGTTANGVGTYVSATCVCSNPNMTFNGSALSVTGNINASTYVCAPTITGSTKVCSPIINGTTCISSPITCGTTCSISPIIIGSTCVCSPRVYGSTCVEGPIVNATSCVTSPYHCGACMYATTCVCSPIITGSTCIISPRIYGTTCVCGGVICATTVATAACTFGTTCVCSPIVNGSTCVCGAITCGGTCVVTPVINSTTCSTSPLHCGSCGYFSTIVCSPIITGSTKVCSPIVCGTSCIVSPIHLGTTCVCSPTLCASTSAFSVTPAANNNSTCIATTAWYFGQCATATPTMDGNGTVGTSALWSHSDHVHPRDTSKASLSGATFTGTLCVSAAALCSACYFLGSDLSLLPIANSQSAVSTWWGMQLRGLYQADMCTTPVAVGNCDSYSIIIKTDCLPTVSTLTVIAAATQTAAVKLQTWQTSALATVASVDCTGKFIGSILSGSTCILSPIIIGTTCVCSPIGLFSTSSCSPIHCGACGYFTTACATTVSSSSCLCSNGTTKLVGATTGSTLFLTTTPPAATMQQPTLFYDSISKQIEAKQLTGGSDNYFYCECATKVCCTSATCVKYIGYCPTTLAGRFSIDFNVLVGNLTASRCTFSQFNIDGVVQGQCILDCNGASAWVQSHQLSRDVTFTAGQHCFDIWYWDGGGASTCSCAVYGSIRVNRIC